MKKLLNNVFSGLLCLLPLVAGAQKHVLILTDGTSISNDSTIVMSDAPGAKMSAEGLVLNANSVLSGTTVSFSQTASGAQTIVPALHKQLSASGSDDITYWIVRINKPASQWTPNDIPELPTSPDYVIVGCGSAEVQKCMGACPLRTSLSGVLNNYADARFAFIQPNNSGLRYSQRAVSEEYTMPRHETEQAICDIADGWNASVIPTYVGEFCADGITPRAASQCLIGDLVGRALKSDTHFLSIKRLEPFKITLETTNPEFSTQYAAQALNQGFEVWRTSGDARRLNIIDCRIVGQNIEIETNERLAAGDLLVYGATNPGVGRREGVRGNLLIGGLPAPVCFLSIGNIENTGDNVSGTITCDGVGVPGVTVSDGYTFATTDQMGCYSMHSEKRLGYVFYILPSGYEPVTEDNGWQIRIHAQLNDDVTLQEEHNFELRRIDNHRHTMIVGADAHLAARNSDKSQFKSGFAASVKRYVETLKDTSVYSTILGDLAWDQYWYANNYALPDFSNTLTANSWPIPFFPVMGNHDNDGATPAGNDTDFKAAIPFRKTMAPSFYSYNLGDVHYVVLDDIVYKNTFTAGKTYSEGIVGDRDYGRYYTDEQLEWLRHDLELIQDKTTPVVVCMHIQNWALSTNGTFIVSANLEGGASEKLAKLFADFSEVHLLSGHTHYNFHAHPTAYPNIHENNVAAVCATWWWTGKLVGRHICKDGSPGGYAVYTADGKKLTWKYHSSEDDTCPQMRVYDMNAVKQAFSENEDIRAWLKYDTSQTDYSKISDNTVYINVFNYDTDWKVEVREGDTPLTAKRITAQDPLHIICYEVPRYKAANTVTSDFVTNRTNHMFSVQTTAADTPVTVTVTDSFGRVYTTTLVRPGTYATTMP